MWLWLLWIMCMCVCFHAAVWLPCFTCPFTLSVYLNKGISISKRNKCTAGEIRNVSVYNGGKVTMWPEQPATLIFCYFTLKLANFENDTHTDTHTHTCVHPLVIFPESLLRKWKRKTDSKTSEDTPVFSKKRIFSADISRARPTESPRTHIENVGWRVACERCKIFMCCKSWVTPFSKQVALDL